MSGYEPGTVAVVTYKGSRVRAARLGSGWQMLEPVDGNYTWSMGDHVTDVRPLVVLDLDDYDNRAVTYLRNIARDEDRATVPWQGMWLDESEVTELTGAFGAHDSGEHVQPLYPLVPCRYCGMDSLVLIEGDGHCGSHAQAYGMREDEGWAS